MNRRSGSRAADPSANGHDSGHRRLRPWPSVARSLLAEAALLAAHAPAAAHRGGGVGGLRANPQPCGARARSLTRPMLLHARCQLLEAMSRSAEGSKRRVWWRRLLPRRAECTAEEMPGQEAARRERIHHMRRQMVRSLKACTGDGRSRPCVGMGVFDGLRV